MEAVFLQLLNMSVTASWLALAVMLLRALLRKAPKSVFLLLWALVGIRLVCPVFLESSWSLMPPASAFSPDMLNTAVLPENISVLQQTGNEAVSGALVPAAEGNLPAFSVSLLASAVWIAGIIAMTLYAVLSYLRIYSKVRESIPLGNNIRLCDRISAPFLFGLFRPQIYLPSGLDEQDAAYVIAHEQAHRKRGDHWWKPLGFLLLTVHWFNPILWISYFLFCKDIELSCDEKVIKNLGIDGKKSYSEALLRCSMPGKVPAACPLFFGESGIRSRIKAVLTYKKPAVWVSVLCAGLCLLTALLFLTNPPASLNEKLRIFLDGQVASHHQTDKTVYSCQDLEILGTKRSGKNLTVYMWVLYQEYQYKNGLTPVCGAHTPTAVTVRKENGAYQLVEYWEPRDGSRYAEDIRSVFPLRLRRDALNPAKYIDRQTEACRKMALAYFSEQATRIPAGDTHATGNAALSQVYRYEQSPDPLPPTLLLSAADKTFQFTYSAFSSYIACGVYEQQGKTLTLYSQDGEKQYIFHEKNGSYVFDAARSSPIPEYRYSGASQETESPVPDGAVFAPAPSE